jgi:hypothetical protein
LTATPLRDCGVQPHPERREPLLGRDELGDRPLAVAVDPAEPRAKQGRVRLRRDPPLLLEGAREALGRLPRRGGSASAQIASTSRETSPLAGAEASRV